MCDGKGASMNSRNSSGLGDPTWEVAYLFPSQGSWSVADLVVEVVNEDHPDRDWVEKRREYAQAGIAEYWIVDPRDSTVTIFSLEANATAYSEGATFRQRDAASSYLLDGFSIPVTDLFAQS
jgi:Uma2 family endonuclease